MGLRNRLGKEAFRKIFLINTAVAVYSLCSLAFVMLVHKSVVVLKVLLFTNMINFGTNMVIFYYGQKTIKFTFDVKGHIEKLGEMIPKIVKRFNEFRSSIDKIQGYADEVEEVMGHVRDAGVTAKKLSEFEPLIDKFAEGVDRVGVEKMLGHMEEGIQYLEAKEKSDDSDALESIDDILEKEDI